MSKSLTEALAEARLPRRLVSICLRGDLTVEAQRIEDQLDELEQSSSPVRLTDGGDREALAEKLEALREQMIAKSTEVELEAMSSLVWRTLKAKHPVGAKPTTTDNAIGADAAGFFNDAVRASFVETVTDAQWEHLTSVLTEGEWSKLCAAVYSLNEEPVSIPFSLLGSEILRTRAVASESPEPKE